MTAPLARIRVPLATPRLLLRLPTVDDLRPLVASLRDPVIARWTGSIPTRISAAEVRRWIERAADPAGRTESLSLVIALPDARRTVGGISLRTGSRESTGDLGYWIGRAYRGRGFASEAVGALCTAAFRQAKLHRLTASIFPGNDASEAVLRRAGFRREGRSRRSFRKFGVWRDELHFGMLAPDLRALPAPQLVPPVALVRPSPRSLRA